MVGTTLHLTRPRNGRCLSAQLCYQLQAHLELIVLLPILLCKVLPAPRQAPGQCVCELCTSLHSITSQLQNFLASVLAAVVTTLYCMLPAGRAPRHLSGRCVLIYLLQGCSRYYLQ